MFDRYVAGLATLMILLVLFPGAVSAAAQQSSPAKPVVGILPLDDGTGKGISPENAAAFAKQLRAALLSSSRVTPQLVNLRKGVALPLEPRQAGELGRAAGVDVIVAATLVKAETKQSDKGLHGLGGMLGGLGGVSGGARVQSASAEVKLQTELVSVADARRLDTFSVDGKKSDAKVSTNVNSGLGSTDMSSPGFQESPVGQALQQAVQNLAAQLERRAGSMPANAAALGPAPAAAATEGEALLAQNDARGQAGASPCGKGKRPIKGPCTETAPSRKAAAAARPAPEIYQVRPDTAPPGGVGEVILTGSNLTPDLRVKFDCNANIKGTFKVESSSRAVAKIRVPLNAGEERCPISLMRPETSNRASGAWDWPGKVSGYETSRGYPHAGSRGYGGAGEFESNAPQGTSHRTDESEIEEIGESGPGTPEIFQLPTCAGTNSKSSTTFPGGMQGRFIEVAQTTQTCTLTISESATTMPVAVQASLLGEGPLENLNMMDIAQKMQAAAMSGAGFGEKGEASELLLSSDSVKFVRAGSVVFSQPRSAVKSVDEMKFQGQSMGIFRIVFSGGKTYNFMQMGGPEGRTYKIVKRKLGK